MNTTAIFAAIIALLVGAVGGATIRNNDEPRAGLQQSTKMSEQTMNENPLATDYVSVRPSVAELPNETLSTEETDGLLLMREEEKLARDVYQTLYDKWGIKIFANIAQSEQTHTEAVRDLLEKYNLSDPVTDDTIGVFKNTNLQSLYDSLVTRGNTSEVEALTVGAIIEDLDIKDLQNLINKTDNQDIKLVYENLVRGSRNHMRSFTKQLTMRDVSYEPSYISNEDYQSIIAGEQETGNQKSSGGQGGRGWGKRNQ